MASEYRRCAADKLRDIGLITQLQDDRGTRRFEGIVVLDAFVYPYASLERLLAAGAFSQWLFFLDDQYDDHPGVGQSVENARRIMEQAYDMLCSGRAPGTLAPFARLTDYLKELLSSLCPPGWMPRFLTHVGEYLFQGSLVAVEHWSRGCVPATDDYLGLRMHDSAVFPALDMIEVAAALELPGSVLAHPVLVEMGRLAVRHTAYVNDLFSYQKEVLWSGTPCNLVHVLMHNERLGFQDAVRCVVELVNSDAARFVELEANMPHWDPALATEVDAYLGGMKSWMRGNVDFSLASQRYRAADSPFLELRGYYTARPGTNRSGSVLGPRMK